jgi:hypothetical protein
MAKSSFPPIGDWAPTLETLSQYAAAIGVVPRALAEPHPKWWHISLKIQQGGAATDPIPYPNSTSATFRLLMNLMSDSVDVSTSLGELRSLSMAEGLSATEFGTQLISMLAELGIEAQFEREKFEDDEIRTYDSEAASSYREVLINTARILEFHRASLSGDTGPIQLWPHNFDLAFEWFGTRQVPYGEDGSLPSQINFGLAPGDSSHAETYFYSNPWPFEDSLTNHELPAGAQWFTDSWKGSLLPYREVAGDPEGDEKIAAYFKAIYEIASPLLTE